MIKFKRNILWILIIITATAIVGYLFVKNELENKISASGDVIIIIPKGTNLDGCVNILNQENLFLPAGLYEIIAKSYSVFSGRHLIAGAYKFKPELTNKEVLTSLFWGRNLFTITITYPEGITLKNFAEITEKKLKIDSIEFINFVNSDSLLKKYGIEANTSEGYLMPNTYDFFFNVSIKNVISRLLDEQDRLWANKFAKKAKQKGWSRHKVLTLASIIEAETPVPDERARISGVYHNRLKKGMLLQADPTVQYIVGGKKRLFYSDLRIKNPYNTYLYKGLPPGPINSPSESSIEAALNPEKNEYLFFVAKGDGSNRHNFSRDIIGHQRNVLSFRRRVR